MLAAEVVEGHRIIACEQDVLTIRGLRRVSAETSMADPDAVKNVQIRAPHETPHLAALWARLSIVTDTG